ncbi:MAG: SIMPL domain-containing protein, partial [Prolixibacteraceae bacterium]|nr:SIMPL domain-containing protein [Prolixibacteraceae bacterium]
ATTAGRAIQELETLGLSNIAIEKVDHSEIEKLKTEVKINAIKAARDKADALTNAIGQNTRKAIYIQEINNQMYRAQMSAVANIKIRGVTDMEMDQQPEIEFEKILLDYSILVRFAIE